MSYVRNASVCALTLIVWQTACSWAFRSAPTVRNPRLLLAAPVTPLISPKQRTYFATCFNACEDILHHELGSDRIRAHNIRRLRRGCEFQGDFATALRTVMWSRTAVRVMERIGELGPVRSADELLERAKTVPWPDYIADGQTIKVETVGVAARLTHSHFNALTVKNAVVDAMQTAGRRRPPVSVREPHVSVHVYVHDTGVQVYRSLGGSASLHKRGNRDVIHKAALKETVAAAGLFFAGFDTTASLTKVLCDPMCGSGTIPIEAALIAADTAPRLVALGQACAPGAVDPGTINARILVERAEHSKVIPALRWVDADRQAWEQVLQDACEADRRLTTSVKIFANDVHPGSITLAKDAAARAGVQHLIDFSNCDIRDYRPPIAPNLVVTNPPWQLRIQTEDDPWRLLRDWCKQRVADNMMLWTFRGDVEASAGLRLKVDRRCTFQIGETKLQFLGHEIRPDSLAGS